MKHPFRPHVVPGGTSMADLAKQVAAYRAALVAQGLPDDLADRLTVEFQRQIFDLASRLEGRPGIETK